MNTLKIKKGDTVQVMMGKDKGKSGEVVKVLPLKGMVVVENINQFKGMLNVSDLNGINSS